VKVLIDTCIFREVMHPSGHQRVKDRFAAIDAADMYVSVMTVGEIRKGIEKLDAGPKRSGLEAWIKQLVASSRGRILPVDLDTMEIWGEISGKALKQGTTLPVADGIIAATAIQHGLRVMTRNVKDFESSGVLITNPWDDA